MADRLISFDTKIDGVKLNETFAIQSTKLVSRLLCAAVCVLSRRCKYFSFCYSEMCQLYSIDNLDITFTNSTTVAPHCTLHAMKGHTLAQCVEKGDLKPIKDDLNPRNCDINLKRSDAIEVWSKSLTSLLTYSEYRVYYEAICILQGEHGGHQCTGSDRVVEYIMWRSGPPKSWFEAQSECEEYGATLFDNLNGTGAQLQLISQYMNYSQFWLGISDDGHEGLLEES